eukprot:1123928-Rhodomonas_salina.1
MLAAESTPADIAFSHQLVAHEKRCGSRVDEEDGVDALRLALLVGLAHHRGQLLDHRLAVRVTARLLHHPLLLPHNALQNNQALLRRQQEPTAL